MKIWKTGPKGRLRAGRNKPRQAEANRGKNCNLRGFWLFLVFLRVVVIVVVVVVVCVFVFLTFFSALSRFCAF